MLMGEIAKGVTMGLKHAEGQRHSESRLGLMVSGPLKELAYIILLPLASVVMSVLLGTYKLGQVLRVLLRR